MIIDYTKTCLHINKNYTFNRFQFFLYALVHISLEND